MHSLVPGIFSGVHTTVTAPAEMSVSQVRGHFEVSTGFQVHIHFRVGPAIHDETGVNFPAVAIDDLAVTGDYVVGIPPEGHVIYVVTVRESLQRPKQ